MVRRGLALILGWSATLALTPGVAAACPVCLDSASGSRAVGAAFLGLMLAPFAVAAAFAGVIAWSCARGRRRGD
jgi:hypothetical protein